MEGRCGARPSTLFWSKVRVEEGPDLVEALFHIAVSSDQSSCRRIVLGLVRPSLSGDESSSLKLS
jgi:hypothetical protein